MENYDGHSANSFNENYHLKQVFKKPILSKINTYNNMEMRWGTGENM
jgi:hypothetical protein